MWSNEHVYNKAWLADRKMHLLLLCPDLQGIRRMKQSNRTPGMKCRRAVLRFVRSYPVVEVLHDCSHRRRCNEATNTHATGVARFALRLTACYEYTSDNA